MVKYYKKKLQSNTEGEPEMTEETVGSAVEVVATVEEIKEAEVVTNTVLEVAPAPAQAKKIIYPEDMDATMKLEDPKPVIKVVPPIVSTGKKAIIVSSSVKEIIGKEGEVLEVRGDDSVVQVGHNKYLIANSALTQV